MTEDKYLTATDRLPTEETISKCIQTKREENHGAALGIGVVAKAGQLPILVLYCESNPEIVHFALPLRLELISLLHHQLRVATAYLYPTPETGLFDHEVLEDIPHASLHFFSDKENTGNIRAIQVDKDTKQPMAVTYMDPDMLVKLGLWMHGHVMKTVGMTKFMELLEQNTDTEETHDERSN